MKAACTLAVATALLAQFAGSAVGCGYHGALGNSLSALHLRSIEVAVALREAADAGKIDSDILAPKTVNLFRYRHAVDRLQQLGKALNETQAAGAGRLAFTILLVESALWTRYAWTGGELHTSVHADGPQGDDVVIVTGEAALAAIKSGKLSATQAFLDGLIVVSGAQDRAPEVASAVTAAMNRFVVPHGSARK